MLLKTAVIFCFVGLVELRPQNVGNVLEQDGEAVKHGKIHEDNNDDSALLDNRFRPAATGKGLKDLKDIDHSLRTVATQLLNTSGSESYSQMTSTKLPLTNKSEKPTPNNAYTKIETRTEPVPTDTTTLVYGRPINSKFSYFGSSHPGEAMALTEEEIERELNMTKIATTQQSEFTTTGGISTWILLNPPSTSMKNLFENVSNSQEVEQHVTADSTIKPTTIKNSINFSSNINKVLEFLPEFEVPSVATNNDSKAGLTLHSVKPVKSEFTTTSKLDLTRQNESLTTTTHKPDKKILVTTLKPSSSTKRITTPTFSNKNTTSSKITVAPATTHKPTANRVKNPPKRVTPKPTANKTDQMFTSKIEKVTLKPVPLVSTEKTIDHSEPPIFISKLKGTITTTSNKKSNNTALNVNKVQETTIKIKPAQSNATNNQESKNSTKSNNKLASKISIPSLKMDKTETEVKLSSELSKPILTKITVSSPPSSTTKRPRHSSKKKKNKSRRRKPVSSTSSTTVKTSTTELIYPGLKDTTLSSFNNVDLQEIQESKIEPETKQPQQNSTKTKPPKNPLTTQIYNFLSREVMPSFGVMSLVGLGLGIASYFLYPFGGAITRRNYAAEPNYKYNLDEYGGNNGQNEEEVLKQVFQGMTAHESNMNNNNYNYYRYSGYNDANTDGSKKNTVRYSNNEPSDKPVDNSKVKINYRNLDYKLQNINRPIRTDENGSTGSITVDSDGNRQFVVGSVLQDYITTDIPKAEASSNDSNQNANFYSENGYGSADNDFVNADTVSSRPDDGYDKLEITSTVVAVEHGPRALKIKRSVDVEEDKKKESVIQVIPLRSEDPKENDLSNEIFDIIDSVIPGHETKQNINDKKINQLVLSKQEDSSTNSKTTEKPFGINLLIGQASSEAPKETAETTTKVLNEITTESSSTSTESTTKTYESSTTNKSTNLEPPEKFNIFNFMRNIAEVKFRLGLTLLKHASEGFTKYISHVQKRLNGET